MTEQRTDHDLLTACQSGDRQAFEIVYSKHQRRVFSVALNFFGGDDDRAKDVTQQVFLKIFGKLDDFRGEAEFTTWLYRITVNACLDEKRKTRRFFSLDFLGDFGLKRNHDDKIHRKEIAAEVNRVLVTLKPKFRLPILLKYVEGLSYDEISKILDCSIGTVSSRMNRAHKMLAGKLAHLRNEIL